MNWNFLLKVSISRHISLLKGPAMEGDEVALSQSCLSKEETEGLVAEVMRFMLFKNYSQSGAPVRREEITQLVTKNYKHRGLPALIIKLAQARLLATFGLEMKELQRVRAPSKARGKHASQAVPEAQKLYVLRSALDDDMRKKYVDTKESSALSALALIVVGIIQLSGDNCSEETLWNHLQKLGIQEDDENHHVFGNIRQALETLTRQRYIQREKVITSDSNGFSYNLAEKALEESIKEKIQSFIVQLTQGNRMSVNNEMMEDS